MPEAFRIRIADRVIGIHAMYPHVKKLCSLYITRAEPSIGIAITQADIDYERRKSDRETALEGNEPSPHTDAYLETLAVYRKIADALLADNVLLFHGSVIAVDGVGYMFTAKSGTGKSTHARLWRERFGDRAVMINDDKPLLKITDAGVIAYGTPWNGKHHLDTNTSVPLKAICILCRGEANRIEPVGKKEAYPLLCQQSNRASDPEGMLRTLKLIEKLSGSVALYRLTCNMDPEAALVAYQGMNT